MALTNLADGRVDLISLILANVIPLSDVSDSRQMNHEMKTLVMSVSEN